MHEGYGAWGAGKELWVYSLIIERRLAAPFLHKEKHILLPPRPLKSPHLKFEQRKEGLYEFRLSTSRPLPLVGPRLLPLFPLCPSRLLTLQPPQDGFAYLVTYGGDEALADNHMS